MLRKLRKQKARVPRTKLERTVSELASGALVDHLKRYVNMAGTAARVFEDTGDPSALDSAVEAGEALLVVARELLGRTPEAAYAPRMNLHLQELVDEFLRRHGAVPPGVIEAPKN